LEFLHSNHLLDVAELLEPCPSSIQQSLTRGNS
jgi:hypothetical protein